MTSILITHIGEFFTGDLESPEAGISSLLIEDGRIAVDGEPRMDSALRLT